MADGSVDNIFVCLGGEQEIPEDVTHVIVKKSVKIIPTMAFYVRTELISVEFHDGVEKVERRASQDAPLWKD